MPDFPIANDLTGKTLPDTDQDFAVEPLDAPLGARVTGLDLTDLCIPGPPAAARQRRLVDALYRHHVLIFPAQDLDPDAFTGFGALWGEPYIETYETLQLPGHPAIMQVGNVGPALAGEAFRNGASFWHTDRAYAADCDAITMLLCKAAPAEGGETLFANTQAAYEALPEADRAEIEGLVAAHWYGAGAREDWELGVHPMTPEQAARLPPPGRHALARRHSVTGRKGLFAAAGSAIGVTRDGEDLDPDEAGALLRRLKLHAIQERFVMRHRYSPGDLVLWDNTATLHYANPVGPPTDAASRRLLYRIVATGLPPVLREDSL